MRVHRSRTILLHVWVTIGAIATADRLISLSWWLHSLRLLFVLLSGCIEWHKVVQDRCITLLLLLFEEQSLHHWVHCRFLLMLFEQKTIGAEKLVFDVLVMGLLTRQTARRIRPVYCVVEHVESWGVRLWTVFINDYHRVDVQWLNLLLSLYDRLNALLLKYPYTHLKYFELALQLTQKSLIQNFISIIFESIILFLR